MSDYTSTFTKVTGNIIQASDFTTEFDAIEVSSATKADESGATLTTATLTSPKINEIIDTNGNELVKFTTTASAVNEITVTNGASGNSPAITQTGSDVVGISFPSGFTKFSLSAGITAYAGGGQANAVELTSQFNEVSTVGTAADSVKLPPAQAGLLIRVLNTSATALSLFPASGDNLGSGVDTSINVAANQVREYFAYDTTNWKQISQS